MFLTKLIELLVLEFFSKEKFTDKSLENKCSLITSRAVQNSIERERSKKDLKNLDKYIDLDIEKYKITRKNEEIVKDLNKKIHNQEDNIKKLENENSIIIKLSKTSANNINNYTNQYNKYKNYNIVLLILNLIIGYLLFKKYKQFK